MGFLNGQIHIGDKTLVVEERARVLRMESLKI
jgi:hypothetical protein